MERRGRRLHRTRHAARKLHSRNKGPFSCDAKGDRSKIDRDRFLLIIENAPGIFSVVPKYGSASETFSSLIRPGSSGTGRCQRCDRPLNIN